MSAVDFDSIFGIKLLLFLSSVFTEWFRTDQIFRRVALSDSIFSSDSFQEANCLKKLKKDYM